jgi:MYND finger
VIVPLSGHCTPGGYSISNFPLLRSADGQLTLWNVHRLNLEHLPTFDPRRHKTDWVNLHVSLALSDREIDLRAKKSPSTDVLVNVKDSIHSFFMRAVEPNARRIFSLSEPTDGGYTIIFLNRLCLDVASSALVADVCILPLTFEFLMKHVQTIAGFERDGKMMSIVTEEEEVRTWKHLLPVFVERSRTWSHSRTCQYVQAGQIPLSDQMEQNPICACGEGVELGAFSDVPEWKSLAPFVTRAAISPLFAVSYLESIGGAAREWLERARFNGNVGNDEPDAATVCAKCGSGAREGRALLRCSRCSDTKYCGRACQKADWAQHKKQCKASDK